MQVCTIQFGVKHTQCYDNCFDFIGRQKILWNRVFWSALTLYAYSILGLWRNQRVYTCHTLYVSCTSVATYPTRPSSRLHVNTTKFTSKNAQFWLSIQTPLKYAVSDGILDWPLSEWERWLEMEFNQYIHKSENLFSGLFRFRNLKLKHVESKFTSL